MDGLSNDSVAGPILLPLSQIQKSTEESLPEVFDSAGGPVIPVLSVVVAVLVRSGNPGLL